MKVSSLITGITIVFILFGYVCYFYYDQIQIAPTFTINNEEMKLMGEEGKFVVEKKSWRDKSFLITNRNQEYIWYFWGELNKLQDKELQIVATKKKTGEKLLPFISSVHPNNNLNLGTAYSRIEMVFPSKGIWKLEIFIGGNLWGTVDVKVRDILTYKRTSTTLTPPSIRPLP